MMIDVLRRLRPARSPGVACVASCLLGFMVSQAAAADPAPLLAYVGTFSAPLRDMPPTQVDLPPGNGLGIHRFRVDRTDGTLLPAGVHRMGTSPSCLAVNRAQTHLYSANETARVGADKQGTVSSFSIDPVDGQLTLLNEVPSGGAGPTYVSVHPTQRYLLVANYFGGSIAVLPIQDDGRLGAAVDVKAPVGTLGPRRATNAPPGSFAISGHDRTHAHMIRADPSARFVLHVDLGLDQLFVWRLEAHSGTLTPHDPAAYALPPGDGPRHFDFHPNGRWLYSIQEEGSTVAWLDFEPETGRISHRQTVSTLPPGFAGTNFCSEILVSPDGRFVYAGNRLYDSIAVFQVGATGELSLIHTEWTRGDYPRSFALDPDGRFLYSCNQRADNVTQFAVDRQTGKLSFTGHFTPVGNPSMILFVDLQRGKDE